MIYKHCLKCKKSNALKVKNCVKCGEPLGGEIPNYRMLWLNPSDNQGVRFVIDNVRPKLPGETINKKVCSVRF